MSNRDRSKPEPTREEIRLACLEIQKEWSRYEEQKRAGVGRTVKWRVPRMRDGE